MKKLYILLLSGFLFITIVESYSQDEKVPVTEMSREQIMNLTLDDLLELSMEDLLVLSQKLGISIDELLKMKTTVASKTELTPRETPGIISIITEEEIKKSGARDLIDVLRMVPGFEFGYDGYGVIGLGMRGNWVHEGKLLLMVDNQEMNDLFYNNNAFGNHFNVQEIKRIEIIRGPGSAIYGGNAELGVINIVTKKGEDIKGAEGYITVGQLSKINGRNNYNLLIGNKIGNWDVSVKGFIGWANRSQEKDIMFSEDTVQYMDTLDYSEKGSKINTQNLNFTLTNKNLSVQFICDNYVTEYTSYADGWHAMNEFKTYLGEVKYKFNINEKLSLTPLLSYKNSTPYFEEGWYRNPRIVRYKGNLTLNYNPVKNLDLLAGLDYYRDHCWMFEDSVGAFFYYDTTKNDISFNNTSLFFQGTYKWNKLNFVAGARVEHHDYYGNAFAPRAGITGIFGDFHFKLLFSRAFRAPGMGNIDVSSNLKSEFTNVAELEMGYKINANSFVTTNFYHITIFDPIIYFEIDDGVEPITEWGYRNSDKSGSLGIELEYRSLYEWGSISGNYSFYSVSNHVIPEFYSVPGFEDKVLAFAPHKFTLMGTWQITKSLSASPSLNFISERYAYDRDPDSPDLLVIKKFDPAWLININFHYANLFINGLDLSVGCYDILNQKTPVLQPYSGWKPPYPGRAREFVATLAYRFKVK